MNPLPGMTQGARKRAARAIAMAEALRDDPDMPFWARNLTERPMEAEPRDRREALRYFHGNERTHDETVTYRIVRARYRIGERLRPCPGCDSGIVHSSGMKIHPMTGNQIPWVRCDASVATAAASCRREGAVPSPPLGPRRQPWLARS